jgi:predicted Zn finger-like uncharacterized protein
MALATQCPHCGTMFRVASDQLKLRGGIVRCGSCQEIFDGSASLVDLDAPPPKAPAPVEPEAAPAVQAEAPAAISAPLDDEPLAPLDVAVELPRFEDQPVYTLDFDHTFDPFGILPKVDAPDEPQPEGEEPAPPPQPPWSQLLKDPEPVVGAPEPANEPVAEDAAEPAPAPEEAPLAQGVGRIEPAFGLPVDEELVAAPLPDHEPELEPEPEPEPVIAAAAPRSKRPADDAPPMLKHESPPSTISHPSAAHVPPVARTAAAKRADKAAARRSKLTPTRIEAPPRLRAAEVDEPEFIKRGRQQEQNVRARKIALVAGAIALLVLLVMQGTLSFRNALAARFPAAKPVLVSSCAVFGCRVELPAQIDNIAIETGELTTLGGGVYSFTTELRNTAATAQAWPSLELALTDANDKPLVRRVFGPTEYLAAGTVLPNGIAPRTEQAIKLHFRVDNLKPSGYHIAVFYP